MLYSNISKATELVMRGSIAQNAIKPNGVEGAGLTWANGGHIGDGMDPSTGPYAVAWGLIYKAQGATVSPNVLVKTKDITLWGYSISAGGWVKIREQVRPEGAQYPENFNVTTTPPIGATYYSLSPDPVIVGLQPGRCYHFYTGGTGVFRPLIDLNDIKALISTFEAKLISISGDDISDQVGTVVAAAGCDWWPNDFSPTGLNEAYHGSFDVVTTSYKRFFASSMTPDDAVKYPVPDTMLYVPEETPIIGRDPDYRMAETWIPFAAGADLDFSLGPNFYYVMTGNSEFVPVNVARMLGRGGRVRIKQDSTGGRTMTWPSAFKWQVGADKTLSTAADAEDYLLFDIVSETRIKVSLSKNWT